MFKKILFILFSLIYLSTGQQNRPYSCVVDWFTRSGLNKYVTVLPRQKLKIYYGNRMVNLGNYFKPDAVRYQPYVYWNGTSDSLYTLVMFDPDAGEYSQIRHWLVINIKGNDLNTGDSISDYLGAGPPENTGYHRYAFLLYKQKRRINDKLPIASSRSLNGRTNFSVEKFAKKYDLGNPVYGNFFEARYNSYVNKFYENLEDD